MFSNSFPLPHNENSYVYGIISENVVEPVTQQMTIKYGACALQAG